MLRTWRSMLSLRSDRDVTGSRWTMALSKSGPRQSVKCSADIHPGAQLAQETAMQKFIDYPDYLVRAAALAAVYKDSSVRPFEDFYQLWNEVGQQTMQYAEHTSHAGLPPHQLPVLQHTFVPYLVESPIASNFLIMFVSL
ncbi:hypothetical protein TNCV_3456771 [Trichonephila clavipes]|nr:hypothetical protein TNCV_3456771 [Trichonephila clavipes]